jgi:hypothetical protein
VTSLRALAAAALVVVLGPLARAQSGQFFDPTRDLEGFEAADASPYADLYALEHYRELVGKELAPAALADLRGRWKTDHDAGDAKVAALRADPPEECLWLLHRRLARSEYFSKITWTEDRSIPGIVLLVQRPSKELPDYAAKIAREYGPWLAKLATLFDEQYAKPLVLERPRERALWAVAILASEGDYRNFWSIHSNFGPEAARACHDPKLGISVGFEDPFKPGGSVLDNRYPILNAFVRGMIDGYSTSPGGRPGALWIEEGLASYLAYHEGLEPACLATRVVRPATRQTIVDMAQDKKRGPVLLHPIEDLVALRSSEDIDTIVMRQAQAAAVPPPPERDVLSAFYGQSALWMHFLHAGLDGSLREPFLKYFRWALSGDAGPGVLRLAYEGKDLAAIDRSYLRWLAEEGRLARPASTVDTATIDALFAARGAAPAGSAAAPAPAIAFAPAVLAVEATDVESRHGLALLQARDGDVDGAIVALKTLLAGTVGGEDGARIGRDVARLVEFAKLRDGFLQNLRESGAKWSTEVQGKKLVASIAKVEGGFVHLAENRQRVDKIPLAALDPMEIARAATKKEQQGNSAPWARFYAYVLAEDGRWEKLLKDSSDEARALREDARTWVPERLRAGRAAAALNELSKTSLPKSSAEGEALSASIKDFLSLFREMPLVQRKLGSLKGLARAAAEAACADVEPASLLHGKWAAIENGQVAVTYDFDSPAEAQDFVKQVGYLKAWRKALKLDAGKEDESAWVVQDGSFTGVGAACYRFPLAFSAPMVVKYDLQVLEGKGQGKEQANFAVGLCDDRKENEILSVDFGGLAVRDFPRGIELNRVAEGYSYVPATTYSIEVRHDGTNVSVSVDGDAMTEAPAPSRNSGDVFLWFHTTLPVSIERLEIRGKVDPASARALRASTVEKRLVEMGFPR